MFKTKTVEPGHFQEIKIEDFFKVHEMQEQLRVMEANLRLEKKNSEKWELKALKLQEKLDEAARNEALRNDPGYLLLQSFKLSGPYLAQIFREPFMLSIAEEFLYETCPGKDLLSENFKNQSASPRFHHFRDSEKAGYSFRTSFFFSSRAFYVGAGANKKEIKDLLFPENLFSGVEVTSQWESTATFQALKRRKPYRSVVPGQTFGTPLTAYAFPVFDRNGKLIGSISFSNDVGAMIHSAKSLSRIIQSESETALKNLAAYLKQELEETEKTGFRLKAEAEMNREVTGYVEENLIKIIQIIDKLKVLSLNTSIESSKNGIQGRGIKIIAHEMKSISEFGTSALSDILKKVKTLTQSSSQVLERSLYLQSSSKTLKEKSQVLLEAAEEIASQKKELAQLAQDSVKEMVLQNPELENLFK